MNILQQEDVIKGLPDNVLMQQAQQPTGELPEFLVVSEIQRREKMRKSFSETVPEQSVKDQVLSSGIAAMNPNIDPLMASAMGAQGGQDPMMGQMQDPMQQQMMQDPMQQQMMQQQMMQDPMQQQMPMQDPMMQQQVMAAGGGMMPYRMYNGSGTSGYRDTMSELRTVSGRERARLEDLSPEEIEEYLLNLQRKEDSIARMEKLEEDQSSIYAESDEYQENLLKRQREEDSAAFMQSLMSSGDSSQPAVDGPRLPEMEEFLKRINEPYAGRESNNPASISGGSIPGGLESNFQVNPEMVVGQVGGVDVVGPNDGTGRLVQDRFPITQGILGSELGNAVARKTIGGVDNVIDAGLTAANSAGRFGRAVAEGGDPYNLSKPRETAVGSVVDPDLFNSDDVYNVMQELRQAGVDAGEVIGRDAEYLSDRGPEFVEAGQAGLDYIAESKLGQAAGSAYDVLRTPIPELFGNFFENNPKANLFAAENNTDFLNFIDRTKDSAGSVIDKLRGVTSGLGDVYRNLDTGNDELGYRASWDNGAIKEDTSRIKKKDIDPDLIELATAPNTGENKGGPADTEQGSTAINAPETAREIALSNLGTVSAKDEDTEGLLKGLFGRSYKPMDDGALALINLGAGIAKGDVSGGMLGAVKSIGESRDRDRKDMLAKAQAEFYASGGRGAKDTAMDVENKAIQLFDRMRVIGQMNMYEQLTGKKPTAEIMRTPDYEKIIMDGLRAKIVALERTPINSMSGGSGTPRNKIQEDINIQRMFEGTSR